MDAIIAGPFLRYGNNIPGSSLWRGSALYLTRTVALSAPTQNAPPSKEPPATSLAAAPQPVLILDDSGPDGYGPSKPPQQELVAELLDTEMGWSFWRFDLELHLGKNQRSVRYAISIPDGDDSAAAGPPTTFHTFWLPSLGSPYHWAYTSCNGFTSDVPEDSYARKDPTYLWRDLLKVHSTFPMHCLVGGGDQVYSDDVWEQSLLKEWAALETLQDKIAAAWTPAHESQVTSFYLENYLESYVQHDVAAAYASIPSVFVWDDHDIFDGWGSYDAELQTCPVFQGIFDVAKRYYLLFQQHTTPRRLAAKPEFLPGDAGFHSVRFMGPQVALLVMDMRTTRTQQQIMPLSTYDIIRTVALELPECVEHVVALSGVPFIYPTIPASEGILEWFKTTFKTYAACRSFGKSTGIMDKFNQPEILDDLLDGWMANKHKEERGVLVGVLQEISLTKDVRVTILSGDAHVGGVGRLYGRPKKDPLDDPLFMTQIISSAIMNAPPPRSVVKMLLSTNFSRNVNARTRQKMVRAFWPHHPRTDKLLPRRNWCDITMTAPPFAAPLNPEDPKYGGMRFSLRVEDPEKWLGYAEEVYDIMVPRAPAIKIGKAGRRWRHILHWGLHENGHSLEATRWSEEKPTELQSTVQS